MAISEVSISNSALTKLGAGTILTLSDNTTQGRLANEQYAKVRDSLLQEHPWKFAVGRKQLALSATFTPAYEYENAFQLPSDLLRIVDTDLNINTSVGQVEWDTEIDPNTSLRYLVTDASSVMIKYIVKVTEAHFTPLFAEVLANRLAAEWAYSLTQNASLVQIMENKYKEKIREARSMSAMEASPKQVEANDWFFSRY